MVRLHRRGRRAAALLAVPLMLLAGCGGGGGGPDQTADLTPDQLVQRTARAAQGLKSFRLDFKGEAETSLSPDALARSGTAALALRGPVPFSGAGPVVPPDRFSLDVTAETAGLPLQANVTRVGDDLYLSALGRDYRLGLPAATVRGLDARAVFPTLARWITDPKRDGEEDVDGESTVRLTGGVDAEAAAGDLAVVLRAAPGVIGGSVPTPAQLRVTAKRLQAQLAGSTVTVWVRKRDLLPARLRAQVSIPDGSAITKDLRSARLDLTVALSDYDASLSVSPPQAPLPLNLNDLSGLLGG